MAVRIQLASNFQVVELTYDSWKDVNSGEVEQATAMVNMLGKQVINDVKTKPAEKKEEKEEMATEGQIKYLEKLGIKENKAKKMTKKEAWQYIQDNK